MSIQPVTYQQLLAQQYEENARDLLVYQETDYKEVNESGDEINPHNAYRDVGERINDAQDFQRFSGNRNTDDLIIKPKEFEDKGKASVRYNKDVRLDIFNIDTRFRSYAVAGILSAPKYLTGNAKVNGRNYISPIKSDIASLTSNYIFQTERLICNAISACLSSFELPNRFFNIVDIRNNYYIGVRKGIYGDGHDDEYTKVSVYITDYNISTSTITQNLGPVGQNGFYYSNTSIIPALNSALKNSGFSDLSVSYSNGYCYFNNSSKLETYVLYFTPEPPASGSITNNQMYPTLGSMLGFTNFIYEVSPLSSTDDCTTSCSSNCGQIVMYSNTGGVCGENLIDMNADSYIYLSISDWNNIQHETADNTFFNVFAKIPITVDKGKLVYDIRYNNSVTKTYYFPQPTNIQQFQISLLDKSGNTLLMPNVEWSMTLEIEEVLSQSLYEKMREL